MHVDLPFKGEDLAPGERYYRHKKTHGGTTQALGYDLTARRLDPRTKTWSPFLPGGERSKRESHVVYGKPVYAMSDGVVIQGWRNAPDNPRPGQRHDEVGRGIGGGGNHVVLQHADGSRTLYAHFRPGTVPRRLVPHDAELYPDGDAAARDIPEADRVLVRAGEFLGEVGDSGASSGPHLHVHRVKDGKAADLTFRHGLATPVDGGTAPLDSWDSFAGGRIPPGPVLVWPPRSLRREYARHGVPIGVFGRLFAHLTDSGYAPRWLDGYTVGGEAYLNVVWGPATGAQRTYFGLTGRRYQDVMSAGVEDGFQPVFVESFGGDETRYNVILDKTTRGSFVARHGLDDDAHQAELDKARAAGLHPVCVSPVSVRGQRRYTVLYRSGTIGQWQLRSRIRDSDYQAEFDANRRAGRRPVYLQAYVHDGATYLSAVFASVGAGAHRAVHGRTGAQYQAEYTRNARDGFDTQVVTGVDGARSSHRFAGVWAKA